MRDRLIEIIGRWDSTEPLVDHLIKNGVIVLLEKPLTNFDRIKGMSVEEMAEFIFVNFQTDDWYNPIVDNKVMFHENDVAEWLESEVQGE